MGEVAWDAILSGSTSTPSFLLGRTGNPARVVQQAWWDSQPGAIAALDGVVSGSGSVYHVPPRMGGMEIRRLLVDPAPLLHFVNEWMVDRFGGGEVKLALQGDIDGEPLFVIDVRVTIENLDGLLAAEDELLEEIERSPLGIQWLQNSVISLSRSRR